MINESNINKARNEIEKAFKNKEKVVVVARDEEFNRKILENKKVDMLLFLDFNGKDKLKQRDSGLNHILCKLAKENEISIGIDVRIFNEKDDFSLSLVISRLMQNIRLLNKYKPKVKIMGFSDRDKLIFKALFLSLGLSNSIIKAAFD